jgi:hypothetical protein
MEARNSHARRTGKARKNDSWKGSLIAGQALTILALLGSAAILMAGFLR